MANNSLQKQNGRAATIKKTFSRSTSIRTEITADASIIWSLLTNASDYPRWNPTVISIDGKIEAGEKIRLKSTLDPKRTFKLKVKEYQPERKLVWGDAMGNRVYTLSPVTNERMVFEMTEKIGGPLFPIFARMIPSFDKSFEQFAAALKKEAESIMKAR
jgi:uncharacterized protein YndB with AHSA1/START domain